MWGRLYPKSRVGVYFADAENEGLGIPPISPATRLAGGVG